MIEDYYVGSHSLILKFSPVLCPSSTYFSLAFLFNGCSFARFSCHNAVEPATPSHQWEKAASYYCDSRVKYLVLLLSFCCAAYLQTDWSYPARFKLIPLPSCVELNYSVRNLSTDIPNLTSSSLVK